jgi:hypothetical protein
VAVRRRAGEGERKSRDQPEAEPEQRKVERERREK